jgi:hypothetical protein
MTDTKPYEHATDELRMLLKHIETEYDARGALNRSQSVTGAGWFDFAFAEIDRLQRILNESMSEIARLQEK